MNNQYSYSLDSKVIAVMLTASFLFLGIMAFKYKTGDQCGVVDFSYRTSSKNHIYTDEPVYFSSELKYSADSWEWDFGDKSKIDSKSGPDVNHQYKVPGQYTVRLIINKKCELAKTILVNKREDKGKKLYPMPLWPAEPVYAGQEYNFGDSTTGAVTWSWYFDDETKRLQKDVKWLFTEVGPHKVTLVLNDDIDNNKITKVFNVLAPQVKNSAVISTPGPRPTGGSFNPHQPVITDKPVGDPMDVIAANPKIPTVSDQVLKGYVLAVNGTGYNEMKKYFKNMNYANCNILFNDKTITVDQLKANVLQHNQYGKSFDVKQSLNTDNNIIQIIITATLKSKGRWIGKDKERSYPY